MKKMSEQKKKQTTSKPTKKATAKVEPMPMGSESVRGKVALYQKTAAQFHSEAVEMVQSGVDAMQKGILAMQAGVRDMQSGISEQRKKYAVGAVAFQSGVDEMLANIAGMRAAIAKHAQDNQAYIKHFLG
jgi:hypothetical protein